MKNDIMTPERRARINLYKKIIVYSIFGIIISLLAVSIVLFIKVKQLEKLNQVELVTEKEEKKSFVEEEEKNVQETTTNKEQEQKIESKKEKNIVYLTFDDGPSSNTLEILSILDKYNIKATFFVNGRIGEDYLPLYKAIVDQGSSLGMHSYSHQFNAIYKSMEDFAADTERIHELLFNLTGQDIHLYRFPGGSSTTTTDNIPEFIEYLKRKGYEYYDWNVSGGDASSNKLKPETIVNNVISEIKENDVSMVLLHDSGSKDSTVEALDEIIKQLKDAGYEILPITDSTTPVQHIKK